MTGYDYLCVIFEEESACSEEIVRPLLLYHHLNSGRTGPRALIFTRRLHVRYWLEPFASWINQAEGIFTNL